MKNEYFIGVDGGGTHTRALIIDGLGHPLGWGKSGPSNYDHVGIKTARNNIESALHSAWKLAGIDVQPATAACLGIAGITGTKDRAMILDMAVELHIAKASHITVDHDIRILLTGGLGGESGIALIVGTGSSCYGRNAAGHEVRVGGFGSLVDDLGSGYALGVQALRSSVFAADGRGRVTSLSEPVFKFLGITTMDDFPRRVYHEGLTRTQIASLAPLVISCAEAGDSVAINILRIGAMDLADMVATAVRRMECNDSLALVIGGGLGEAETLYRQEILRALQMQVPKVKVVPPLFPAVVGAALLAMESSGKTFGKSVRDNITAYFVQKEYEK